MSPPPPEAAPGSTTPDDTVQARARERRWHLARLAVFWTGVAIGIVILARQQVTNDAYYMLVRGWLFATGEWWVPFGAYTSAAGVSPGGLVSFLVGLPLLLWRDFRAPAVLMFLAHVGAYLVLDRSLRGCLDPRGRALFAVLCWLNPWHLYAAGWLWNVNWLFPFGALHMATAVESRERERFWASAVHVLAIVCAAQLHMSFVLLGLISAGLVLWRLVRVQWWGVLAGGLLGAASLVPWAVEALRHPELLPVGGDGFPLRGLLLVYPLLRGISYLVRYPSLHFSSGHTHMDFTDALGAQVDSVLGPSVSFLLRGIGPLTVLVPLLACWWLWRRSGVSFRRFSAGGTSFEWLVSCARLAGLASVVAFALSPTTVMWWQAVVALPYLVLPVVLWSEHIVERWPVRGTRAIVGWTVLTALAALAFSLGAPLCRPGGRGADTLDVQRVDPFLVELGVPERVEITPDPENGPASALLRSGRRWYEDEDWLRRGKM